MKSSNQFEFAEIIKEKQAKRKILRIQQQIIRRNVHCYDHACVVYVWRVMIICIFFSPRYENNPKCYWFSFYPPFHSTESLKIYIRYTHSNFMLLICCVSLNKIHFDQLFCMFGYELCARVFQNKHWHHKWMKGIGENNELTNSLTLSTY